MLTEVGLPLSLSVAVSSVGSGSPIMYRGIRKGTSLQTGVQKTGQRSCQQIMARANVSAYTLVVWKITFQSRLIVHLEMN